VSGCCCTVINGQPPITISIDYQGSIIVTQVPGVGPVGPTGPTGPQGAPSTVTGPTGWTGPQGDDGIEVGPTPPIDLDVLWLDTTDPSTACLSSIVLSDWVNPYSYMGVAIAGTSTSTAAWRITRINVGPPVTIGVAEPVAWDDRYTAVYS
jgi:hypothetical protein